MLPMELQKEMPDSSPDASSTDVHKSKPNVFGNEGPKCQSEVPSVSHMTEVRHDNLPPLEEETEDPPNQEIEMFPCTHGGGTPDMLSIEKGEPVNQITSEPPLKQSESTLMTQGLLIHNALLPDAENETLVSEASEMDPHLEDDMVQIDMDMSDDETSHRLPTDMCPPGSDTRDSESEQDAPPGYDTIDRSGQMEMVSQDALSGMGQMVCGNCQELIFYPQGASHVLCTCCQTINLVLEACQVGNITCGQCSMLLMYPFGAPSVRCFCCRYVTEIGVHNLRPPLSVQQSNPTLEFQLTQIS